MKRNEMFLIAKYLTTKTKNKKSKLKRNYFIVLTGIPGSGKTTFSRELERKFKFIKISTDDIKDYLIKIKKDFLLKDLFAIQEKMFKLLMENGVNIISDSNSDLIKYQNKLKRLSKHYNYVPFVVYIEVDLEIAYQRIIKRKSIKNSKRIYKKITKFKNSLQIPKKAFILNGNCNKNKFIREINKIPLK